MRINYLKRLNNKNLRFLRKGQDNLYFIANPIFHINRLHPIVFKNYEIIKSSFFYFKLILKFFNNLAKIFGNLFLSLISNFKIKKKYKKKANLIISHLINPKLYSNYNDFYMHDIIRNYSSIKLSNIFLINCTKLRKSKIEKNSDSEKILSDIILDFNREIDIFLKRIIASFKFLKINKKYKIFINTREKLLFFFSFYEPQYRFNLIILYQVRIILKKLDVDKVYLTYEGHAIDRGIILLSKKISDKIKVYGYYHPPLFDNLLSSKKKIGSKLDPDYLICNSYPAYNFFKKIYKGKTLQSNRNNFKTFDDKKLNKKKLCIVLSEGLKDEMNVFINFIKIYALKNKSFNFIFQIHPNLDFNFYKNIINRLGISNITCKKSEDINYSSVSYAVYRGSGSIIELVAKYKIYPIYLDIFKSFNIDTLFEINQKNRLGYIQKNLHLLNIKDLNNQKKNFLLKSYRYCKNYYLYDAN